MDLISASYPDGAFAEVLEFCGIKTEYLAHRCHNQPVASTAGISHRESAC